MRAMKYVLTVVIGVALLGLCFYGGRVYQNNADQKLFTAYAPPTPGGGSSSGATSFGGGAGASGASASGAGFGGGTSNTQVQAALAVGTPPPQPTPPGAGAVSLPQGASSGGAQRGLVGQLASIAGGTLTVQSFQGPQSVATTARTGYYRVDAATAAALTVGQRVAVTVISGTTQARSVTVVPTGSPFISVRAFGSGGASSSSGSSGFGSGGSSSSSSE